MVFERLTKLFNAGGASRPPKQLEAALLVLSLKSPELMKSTLNYVTTGLPAEALLEFQSSVDNEVRNLLGDPGAGRWPYYRNDLDARVKKALDGRDGLLDCYDAMFILLGDHDALTAEQSVRLGRVLAAAQGAPNLTAADAVPDWLNALWGTSQRDSPKARPRRPTAWDVSRIRALMEADGRDGTEIATATAQLIIRSAPVVSWQSLRHPAIGGTLEFAREHRDLMIQTFKDATADDKLAFLAKVEADPSLDAALEGLLLLAMRDTSKGVRTAAGGAVSKLDPQTRATLLTRVIESTPAGQIESALDLLVRFGDAPARAALESLPANEKNAKKRLLIEAALVRLSDVSAGPETDLDLPPWEPVPDAELGADFVEEALAHIAGVIQKADEQLAEVPEAEQRGWHARNLRDRLALASRLDRRWFEELRAYLNGAQQAPTNLNAVLPSALVPTDSLPLPRLVRLYGLTWRLHPHAVGLDLRAMLDAIERADLEDATTRTDVIAVTPEEFIAMLVFTWSNAHDPEDVWPFFVEHPQKLDQALGLDSDARTYSSSYDLTTAIEILKAFPSLPQRYVARLTELALGTGKSHRLLAQEALANRSNVGEIASRGLTDSRAEVRIAAADWLARLGSEEAVAPLRAALAKEKRETAMAAMLGSLSRLGQDLADDLRKDKLAAEAAKGIKAKAPAALAWFPVESLPRVRWADGSPVERAIVVWWLRLAAKLKDPLGSGLLPIYIGLLDEDSQQELGEFVLHAWIAHDTVGPSDEEARAYAAGRVDQEYDRYQHWARRDRRNEWIQAQAAKPKEQIFEELRRDKAAEYVGSAIDTKGILALSVGARGACRAQRDDRLHPQPRRPPRPGRGPRHRRLRQRRPGRHPAGAPGGAAVQAALGAGEGWRADRGDRGATRLVRRGTGRPHHPDRRFRRRRAAPPRLRTPRVPRPDRSQPEGGVADRPLRPRREAGQVPSRGREGGRRGARQGDEEAADGLEEGTAAARRRAVRPPLRGDVPPAELDRCPVEGTHRRPPGALPADHGARLAGGRLRGPGRGRRPVPAHAGRRVDRHRRRHLRSAR